MAHPADFHAAQRRHWQDAELLFQHDRWANADQLYGLSAECGLKAVMRRLGMPVRHHGVPIRREHKKHVDELWPIFNTFVDGHGGNRYLLPDENPFARWSITDRYANDQCFDRAGVCRHRSAAETVCKMIKRAHQKGDL